MPQHSNTLLFATNTAGGLDVSVNPTGGSPNITLGYKRQEAAWIPLLANTGAPTGERTPGMCPAAMTSDACLFRGNESGDKDAYSVLGTFRGSAEANTNGGASASGNIAQYFATGLAARALAQNGGAQLVNTKATPPQFSADAIKMYTAFKTKQDADVKKVADNLHEASFAMERDTLIAKAYPMGGPLAGYLKNLNSRDAFLAYLETDSVAASDLAKAIP